MAAESIDKDMSTLPGIPPMAVDIVRRAFPPDLIKYMVNSLRSLAEFARVHYSPVDIYSTVKLGVDSWINNVLSLYCRCLCEAGIEVCKK